MSIKSIGDLKDFQNKKVLVRVDYNIPVGEDGAIGDGESWRIKASVETIKYLAERGACVILMTHLGRPDGEVKENLKLDNVSKKASDILGINIKKISDCVGDYVKEEIEKMSSGEIVLLENLRFYKEEEENDSEFAKRLAGLADIYVNDAFSVSHRAHASVEAITKFIPSYAGFSLIKEIDTLTELIKNPEKPATIVIGGLKAKTKLPVIGFLSDKFDNILVSGVVANFLLKSKGIDIGKSVLDDLDPKEVEKIDINSPKIFLPSDVITDNSADPYIDLEEIRDVGDFKILDIGKNTLEKFVSIIENSKTVVWNGTLGMFEDDRYANGTKQIAEALSRTSAKTVVGGGDTIYALDKFDLLEGISHISTGGGAMLEFLSGKDMPGIRALEE